MPSQSRGVKRRANSSANGKGHNNKRQRGHSASSSSSSSSSKNDDDAALQERLRRAKMWKKQQTTSDPALTAFKIGGKSKSKKRRSTVATLSSSASSSSSSSASSSSSGSVANMFSLDFDGEDNDDGFTDVKSAVSEAEAASADSTADVDPLDAFMLDLEQNGADATDEEPVEKKDVADHEERYFGDEAELSDGELEQNTTKQLSWLQRQKLKRKDLHVVNHQEVDYEPFRSDFYIESPDVAAMTAEEVAEYRKTVLHGVKIRGVNCPNPVKTWSQCGLSNRTLLVIQKENYAPPFPIQAQSIPAIMSGRDVIGIAKTGSGKTLSFVLPMIRHVLDQRPVEAGEGPVALVLAPTRELCLQIHAEVRKFGRVVDLDSCAVYGGGSMSDQIAKVKRGCAIIVATPGRLIELLMANNGKTLSLFRVTMVVLDEADRMFDMGFEPQIAKITQNIRPDRQMVLFSATFPASVERLARKTLKNRPLEIMMGERSAAQTDVKQIVEVRDGSTKFNRLLEILSKWYGKGLILVFVDRQETCDILQRRLTDGGYPCLALHGGMDQDDRDYSLSDFKNKLRTIMVATSIIARGFDAKDLVLVINYVVPNHYEDYIHRIGRTGRAGMKGTAITFIEEKEDQQAGGLVKALTQAKQGVPKALQVLADQFAAKVERGEVRFASNNGFITKGFKFDEDEEVDRKNSDMLRTLSAIPDSEKTDEQREMEEELRGVVEQRAEQKRAEKERRQEAYAGKTGPSSSYMTSNSNMLLASKEGSDVVTGMQMDVDDGNVAVSDQQPQSGGEEERAAETATAAPSLADQIAAIKAAAMAASSAIKQNGEDDIVADVVSSKLENVTTISKDVVERQRESKIRSAAKAKAERITRMVTGQTDVGDGEVSAMRDGRFTAELEINDYSKQARFALTHKPAEVASVYDRYDVSVSSKGTFYPPGRKVPSGERKLYIVIDGTSMLDVRAARAAFQRIAEEISVAEAAKQEKDGSGGRYTIA